MYWKLLFNSTDAEQFQSLPNYEDRIFLASVSSSTFKNANCFNSDVLCML